MNKRMTDKRLVKYLMDCRGIEMISINRQGIVVEAGKRFTPADAERICLETGHRDDAKAATSGGRNFIVFPRY
ncbi:MAG: hypothetical protein RR206_04870 [Bacteroidaceae bacterium]